MHNYMDVGFYPLIDQNLVATGPSWTEFFTNELFYRSTPVQVAGESDVSAKHEKLGILEMMVEGGKNISSSHQ